MFSTRKQREKNYLVGGFGILIAYLIWIMSEEFAEPEKSLVMTGVNTFMATMISLLSMNHWVTTGRQFHPRIRVSNPTSLPYSYLEQHHDKLILSSLLAQISKDHYIDNCKLEDLMKDSRSFGFVIDRNFSTQGVPGVYRSAINKIIIPAHLKKQNLQLLKISLSRELRFAIESLNNLRNGLCLFKNAGQNRSYALIHSRETNVKCWSDEKDTLRVRGLIELDLERIDYLFKIVNKAPHQLTDAQASDLKKFATLIKKSNYRQTTVFEYEPYTIKVFNENLQRYPFDSRTNQRVEYDIQKMVSLHREFSIPRYYKFTVYIQAVIPDMQHVVFRFTDPKDHSAKAKQLDFLKNVITRLGMINMLGEKQFNGHMIALVDEVLAPYSQPVLGEEKNLMQWVFKNLFTHLRYRAAGEFRECQDGRRLKIG